MLATPDPGAAAAQTARLWGRLEWQRHSQPNTPPGTTRTATRLDSLDAQRPSSFLHTRRQHVIQSTVSTGAPSRPHERGQCAAHRSEADLSPERAATRPRSCAGAGPTGPRPGTATKHPTGTRTSPEDGKRRARASLKFTRVVLPCTSLAEFTYFCRDYNIMHIIKR